MTPEFRFSVVSTNVDGGRSTAKFLNAGSAHSWAKRLEEEGIKFFIVKLPTQMISMKDLKAQVSADKQSPKRKTK